VEGRIGAEIILRRAHGVGHVLDLDVGLFQPQTQLAGQLLAERAFIGGVKGMNRLLRLEAVAL